jgi:PilZ domain-containing protein
MDSPLSPVPQRRESTRFRVSQPVTIKLASAAISGPFLSARSENISKSGILLSSDFVIPKGSAVELIVDFTPESFSLRARGKVIRVYPQPSEKFDIAVKCDLPFRIFRRRSRKGNRCA